MASAVPPRLDGALFLGLAILGLLLGLVKISPNIFYHIFFFENFKKITIIYKIILKNNHSFKKFTN